MVEQERNRITDSPDDNDTVINRTISRKKHARDQKSSSRVLQSNDKSQISRRNQKRRITDKFLFNPSDEL
jgi:hypothetical protein